MKKKLIIILLVLSLNISVSYNQGYLRRDNQNIVNGNGENVVLRAMGLGGWMLQEGYMMKTSEFANAQYQLKEKIEQLIRFGLDEEGKLIEMCHIFREFWALSTRDQEIKAHVDGYYQAYADSVARYFDGMEIKPEKIAKAVSFIVPYFEGYSITKCALPLSHDELLSTLAETVAFLLGIEN